jgi:hypothetical protein
MPKHRINRPKGDVVRVFIEIGKAKLGVKQSAVAKYLCVSEKTVSLRKSDGEWSLPDFAQLCKYFKATDEDIVSMVRSYQ